MTESKDSPQRKLQFRVICSIMVSCVIYSVYISGVLLTVEPFETQFPGGIFCYKQLSRDYATSYGTGRRIRKDALEAFSKKDDEAAGISVNDRKKMIEDKFYHVYLDNPKDVVGSNTRWMSGIMVSDDVEKMSYCDPLFEKNSGILTEKKLHEHVPYEEKKASELFHQAVYQSVSLPSVDSLAINFTYSGGFLSALVLSFKIIPKMRQLAAEKGEVGNTPVVVSRCSKVEKLCTHYIPLVKGVEFHAGLPSTVDHQEVTTQTFNLFVAMKNGLRVVFPFLKPYIEPTTTTTTTTSSVGDDNAEL